MPRIRIDMNSRDGLSTQYLKSDDFRKEVGDENSRPVRGRKRRKRDRISGKIVKSRFRQPGGGLRMRGLARNIHKSPVQIKGVTIKNLPAGTIVSNVAEAMLKIMSPEPQTQISNYQAYINDTEELDKFAATHGAAFAVYSEGRRIGEIVSSYKEADTSAYKLYLETHNEDIIIQKRPSETIELPGIILNDDVAVAR